MTAKARQFDEMSDKELAQQRGREGNHPFELGRQAALRGDKLDKNPFARRSVASKQFQNGWNAGVGEKSQAAKQAAAEKADSAEEKRGPKTHRAPKPAIQQSLNIPGDENGLPQVAQDAAERYAEAIIARVAASDDETKARKAAEQVMLEQGLDVLPLPNGGKLVKETINETSFHYEPAKKPRKKTSDSEDAGE